MNAMEMGDADDVLNHTPKENKECIDCSHKKTIIETMVEDMNLLKLERDLLQEEVSNLSKTEMSKSYPIRKQFSWKSIRTDAKMKFYTGIKSILFFNILFDLLKPCLPQTMYWRRVKNIRSSGHKKTSDTRTKKVGHKDQFLLVLMRLRL